MVSSLPNINLACAAVAAEQQRIAANSIEKMRDFMVVASVSCEQGRPAKRYGHDRSSAQAWLFHARRTEPRSLGHAHKSFVNNLRPHAEERPPVGPCRLTARLEARRRTPAFPRTVWQHHARGHPSRRSTSRQRPTCAAPQDEA